jgi:hypothetical protein
MGAGGEDILFSQSAGDKLKISVECKSRDSIAVYNYYYQAWDNCPQGREPVLVIKQNKSDPLVVIDAVYYLQLLERTT